MFDWQTIYEVGVAHREELLREAAAQQRALELPQGRSTLRASVSRWLHTLANRIEPTTQPLAGAQPAAARLR